MRAAVKRKAVAQSHTLMPPVRGWIANEPLANSKPGGASVMENFFPLRTSVRARGGSQKYATIAGYTFSRSTTARYYTSSGTIATAAIDAIRKDVNPATGVDSGFLIEAAGTNLILQSQTLDNASWTKTRATISANAVNAPDGTMTADKIIDSVDASTTHQVQQSFSATSGQPYTGSCFFKAAELGFAQIALSGSAYSTPQRASINLATGVSAVLQGAPTVSVTTLANGWYRISVTASATSTTSATLFVYLADASNSVSFTGTGTNGLYAWGVQAEAGSTATSYIPTTTVAVTRGADTYAASAGTAYRMFTYTSGTLEKLFASTSTDVFDISSITDADIIPAASITGQTSGYYSTAQFGTAGGDYLSICNGDDTPQYFDGSAWAAHAFTVMSTPAHLNFVWSFASRLWYLEKNTMKAWYLPVDSINGALTEFSLSGVFQQGGYLVMAGKWSIDAGDGLDDKCFFVSSTGEVAVYEGTDPSNASTWSKVGVYKITPPMGANALAYAGGEPLIGTEDGIVPLSQAVNKDVAALSLAAVTANIEPEWKNEVQARSTMPWEIIKWPTMNMMVVSLPVVSAEISPYCFVCNVETGAWTKYTGWNTRCIALYQDQGYFGTNDGTIHMMESSGADDGEPYVCSYVGLPDHIKSPGMVKTVHSARITFKSTFPANPKVSASVNYKVSLPSPPSVGSDFSNGGEWGVSLWGVGLWGAQGSTSISTKWQSIGKTGFIVSPQVQLTCGYTPYPEFEIIAIDIIHETGAIFV